MRKTITRLHVRAISPRASRGVLTLGGLSFHCALGRSGRKALKREGDGATPIGSWAIRRVMYRIDKIARPRSHFPTAPIRHDEGWCETVGDRNYNKPVRLPYTVSHEYLARQDDLYDIVAVLSHNERPRVQGLGSAVFFHLARPGYTPTAGCVAVSIRDMRIVLEKCGRRTKIIVG